MRNLALIENDELYLLMREISEYTYAAGFCTLLPFELWAAYINDKEVLEDDDFVNIINERYIEKLKSLVEKYNCWYFYNEEVEKIGLTEWSEVYESWRNRMKKSKEMNDV